MTIGPEGLNADHQETPKGKEDEVETDPAKLAAMFEEEETPDAPSIEGGVDTAEVPTSPEVAQEKDPAKTPEELEEERRERQRKIIADSTAGINEERSKRKKEAGDAEAGRWE